MRHKGRENLLHLLRAAHRERQTPALPGGWRTSVMADVARIGRSAAGSELERLAPRFALTAAAVLIVAAAAGSWALGTLQSDIRAAYSNRALIVVSQPWYNL